MFEGWENFYLIVGPSAAALIGLMFVVVTLTAGRERDDTRAASTSTRRPSCGTSASSCCSAERQSRRPSRRSCSGSLAGAWRCSALGWDAKRDRNRPPRLTGADSLFDMWWYGIIPVSGLCRAGRSRPLRCFAGVERKRGRRGTDGAAACQHPRRMGPGHLSRADGRAGRPQIALKARASSRSWSGESALHRTSPARRDSSPP